MSSDPGKLLRAARRVEDMGYSTFIVADHFMMPLAPLVALQAVAGATTTLRLGQLVLAQDFRHPAVLAKELATLDVLSGGRVEVGIGAGWMRSEYEQAGIRFDAASVRIERLEEAVAVVKGLFGEAPFSFTGRHFNITDLDGTPKPVQKHPPILIGGGGPKLLAAAARQADIIQVLPGPNTGERSLDPTRITPRSFLEKIDLIRDAAGERFAGIELGTLLLNVTITDDTERASDEFLAAYAGASDNPALREELLSSPLVAIGSLEQVCDKFLETRERFGFTYFVAPVGVRPELLAPVIERLADR
jgi:probable F420-dependent oxidoreductase